MNQGIVSIGIPTYNSAVRLGPLLENFLQQTYARLEIIVSDDASKDNTYEICMAYVAKDSRIRCIRQEKNLGQLDNFPFVLKEAGGEYFMWASDDDRWSYDFVEKLVNALKMHPECEVAMSSYMRMREGNPHKIVTFTGALDFAGKSHFYMFSKMALDAPVHMLSYGIFRRDFLARLMHRSRPECMRWERVLMAEVTLAANVHTLPDILFFKHENSIPVSQRYQDKLSHAYNQPFAYIYYAYSLLTRQLASPMIPWHRKLYVWIPWIRLLLWRRKSIYEDIIRGIKIRWL